MSRRLVRVALLGAVLAVLVLSPAQVAPPPTMQAVAAQPGATQPATAQPGATQPAAAQPGAAQPAATQPGAAQPGTARSGTAVAQPALAQPAYQWPLAGEPTVTRRFDPPPQRWLPGHRGVDLAAEPGAVVRAAGAGVVFYAGPVAGTGVVSVSHADGLRTTYQPITPTVTAGDAVAAGDPIGVLEPGHAGCTTSACLHWGLRHGDFYLDPLSLLGLGQLRLLPRSG